MPIPVFLYGLLSGAALLELFRRFRRKDRQVSLGTGLLLESSPYIVTAAHVVENARQVIVSFSSELDKDEEISIQENDSSNDVAILRLVERSRTVKGIPLDREITVEPGESCHVLGYSLGEDLSVREPTITQGVVTGNRGADDDPRFFRISASINSGDSGGPVFNEHGQVIGIVVGKWVEPTVENVGFALKHSYFVPLVKRLPGLRLTSTQGSLGTISPSELFKKHQASIALIRVER